MTMPRGGVTDFGGMMDSGTRSIQFDAFILQLQLIMAEQIATAL